MTRSILFESIQQSPIDPLMADCSTESAIPEGYHLGLTSVEESPNAPPRETPLLESTPKMRLIDSAAWGEQLGAGLSANGLTVTLLDKARGVRISNRLEAINVSSNGLFIDYLGEQLRLSDKPEDLEKIPLAVIRLLSEGYEALSAWRSRIVRLSMDTDEYECSLMDDLCPPKTFLVELKGNAALKSVRIQAGMSHWTTGTGRSVNVPTCILEQERDIKSWMGDLAPELALVDAGLIWSDIIQLRAMCLDEDRRLSVPSDSASHVAALGG
jgi:hypothetical protein